MTGWRVLRRLTERNLRDRLTGCYRVHPGDRFPPERAAPWLVPMPGDAVFVGFDLKGFRAINAAYGFSVGSAVLAETGRRLREAARPWPAYRYGGNEFWVAARLAGEEEIRAFAASVRASLERPYQGIAIETWAAAARAFPGEDPWRLLDVLDLMLWITRPRWPELVIAPPDADPDDLRRQARLRVAAKGP
jgi:GGDEF domain-containing protein